MRGGASHAGGHPFDGRVLSEQFRHFLQVVAYPVRVCLYGQVIFYDELFVVEVGEEKILYPSHPENAECQNGGSGDKCRFLVSDQETDAPADEPVDR